MFLKQPGIIVTYNTLTFAESASEKLNFQCHAKASAATFSLGWIYLIFLYTIWLVRLFYAVIL